MNNFVSRRRLNVTITVFLALMIIGVFAVYDASLYQVSFLSGWVLLAVMLFLALFHLRKKLTVLPLGSNSTWLQLHTYAGWLVIVLFGEHVGWRFPDGGLETTLALLFVLVAASGVIGIVLSRTLPPRLTRRGEEVIFERIPTFISQIREEAEELILQSAQETQSSTISDFYMEHLSPFFDGPKNRLRHVMAAARSRFAMLNEINNMQRYLNQQESDCADRLRELVEKKDELDFHYSLNLALKAWLLVHVPLTYGLLMLAVLHMVTAYAFSGGIG